MNLNLANSVTVKVFLGIALTPDVRMQLNQSHAWKTDQTTVKEGRLLEIRYEEKDYLGTWITEEHPSVVQLRSKEASVLEQLRSYCPELPVEKLKVTIFPQIFLS